MKKIRSMARRVGMKCKRANVALPTDEQPLLDTMFWSGSFETFADLDLTLMG